MELNEKFNVDYYYQKLLNKINAGRLLLIVTRGVYFWWTNKKNKKF